MLDLIKGRLKRCFALCLCIKYDMIRYTVEDKYTKEGHLRMKVLQKIVIALVRWLADLFSKFQAPDPFQERM